MVAEAAVEAEAEPAAAELGAGGGLGRRRRWWRRSRRRAERPAPAAARRVRADHDDDIIGDPIGREALINELKSAMIPYTPEELVAIAEKEFAWCEAEMKKAAQRDGLRRRLEGGAREGQDAPRRARQAARDDPRPGASRRSSIVEKNDLVTIPPLCRGLVADGDDVARGAAREPVLHRRRGHQRLVSRRHDDPRAEADDDARQ